MIKKTGLSLALLFVFTAFAPKEEGMFPLSELDRIDLKKAGLMIPIEQIYNPNGTSLVQALVRVGGCTGSFVSDKGLIITNHHCAFSAVAAASDPEHDYLTNGFIAKNRELEIRTSIKARITESYRDVSAEVLKGTSPDDPAGRMEKIAANIEALEKEEKEQHPELLIEVSEMLQGQSYTLFRYRELNDIRLVYVPPRSVGEFGGESDNWVWPRHTGDFSFMRAYVGKDGQPAEYSEDNIPYTPKRYLPINPAGVKENDFVFILGYPGRTYRNQPSQFLTYQQDYLLPYISRWFDYQIRQMEELGKGDKELEIAFASRIKRLANTAKNFKGKMQGLQRTDIVQQRKHEDEEMQMMIAADPKLNAQYGKLFPEIDRIYTEKLKTASRDLWLGQVFGSSGLMYAAGYVGDAQDTWKNSEKGAKNEFLEKLKSNAGNFARSYGIAHPELEKKIIKALLMDGVRLPEDQRPAVLELFASAKAPEESINKFVDEAWEKSVFTNRAEVLKMMEEKPEKLMKLDDPFIQIASGLWEQLKAYQLAEKARQDELSILLPQMVQVRQMYKQSNFLPDANSTLRFTYGYIRGYYPVDAEYHEPFTHIKGILQKASSEGDYFLEDYLQTLLGTEDPMSVVCFLYNLDTTGGNSGSPILDAHGNLVGVNFDRAYTATINDFAWNEEYSRSIGVDIRYVLLVMKKLGNADHLVSELIVSR